MNSETALIAGIMSQGTGCKVDPSWLTYGPVKSAYAGIAALMERGLPINLPNLKAAVSLTVDELDWLEGLVAHTDGPRVDLKTLVESLRADDASRRAKAVLGAFMAQESLSASDMDDIARQVSLVGSSLGSEQFQVVCGSSMAETLEAGEPLLPLDKRKNLVRFGIPAIDHTLKCPAGSLGVIAAITSAGKTTMALQAAAKTAFDGRSTLFVSLEMSHEEIHAKLIGHMIKANSYDLIANDHAHRFEPIVREAVSRFHSICPGSGTNWLKLEARIRELHGVMGFSVVVVDYFTLLEPPNIHKGANSAQMYGEISKSAKRLAQDLDICLVLVSQFNRGPEEGEEPRLKDLRETGQLENDATWALLLWNTKDVVKNGNPIIKCRTAKNRWGERWGLCALEADRKTGNFYGLVL